MTFIFVLAYLALIALTSVGFISATSDWGDFLNLSLGANLWGLVALAAAAGAVMALFGLGGRIDFRSRGVTKLAYVVLFFGHCLLVVAALGAGRSCLPGHPRRRRDPWLYRLAARGGRAGPAADPAAVRLQLTAPPINLLRARLNRRAFLMKGDSFHAFVLP